MIFSANSKQVLKKELMIEVIKLYLNLKLREHDQPILTDMDLSI